MATGRGTGNLVGPIVHQYDYPPHEDINEKIIQRYAKESA